MGMQARLLGYIEEAWPGLAAGGDPALMQHLLDTDRRISLHNDEVIGSLPETGHEWPPLCQPMFGWAPAGATMIVYRNRILHRGIPEGVGAGGARLARQVRRVTPSALLGVGVHPLRVRAVRGPRVPMASFGGVGEGTLPGSFGPDSGLVIREHARGIRPGANAREAVADPGVAADPWGIPALRAASGLAGGARFPVFLGKVENPRENDRFRSRSPSRAARSSVAPLSPEYAGSLRCSRRCSPQSSVRWAGQPVLFFERHAIGSAVDGAMADYESGARSIGG